MSEDIFADEWRDCLRAHYMHVCRNNDRVTEPTLRVIMHDAGFSESELAELRVRATMHVDDVGADFVPDMEVLQPSPPVAAEAERMGDTAPPAEEQPEVFYSVSVPVETDYTMSQDTPELLAESDVPAEEQPPAEAEPVEPPPDEDEPDAPQQLTLF